MGPEVERMVAGRTDDQVDVWALFQDDARGRTGLYNGELVNDLQEGRPGLVSGIIAALRRGLFSADARERLAALHGVNALTQDADFGSELMGLLNSAPELTSGMPFLSAVARQRTTPVVQGIIDDLLKLKLDADADQAFARLLVRHRFEAVRETLVRAVASNAIAAKSKRLVEFVSAMSPSDKDSLTDEFARGPVDARKRWSELAYAAFNADKWPSLYDSWAQLHERLGLTLNGAPPRPYESDEDRARSAAGALRMAAMLAAVETPAALPSAPEAVVLSAAVWVDALRIAEGPPVELQNLLKKHGVKILRSDALLDAIDDILQQLGWDVAARATARARVVEFTVDRDFQDVNTDVALAATAGLDAVYTVGPESGSSRDGIKFHPVHELLTLLRRV